MRLGSSSAGGEFETVSLAQGITKVSFYALGWNGDTTTLTVDYKDGEEDKTVSYSIISDAGFSGTSTTFTISIPSISSLYTIEFTTPCDGTNTLKFSTSGGKKRAIIFGINVE